MRSQKRAGQQPAATGWDCAPVRGSLGLSTGLGALSDPSDLISSVSASQLVPTSGSSAAHMFSAHCHGLCPALGPNAAGVVS